MIRTIIFWPRAIPDIASGFAMFIVNRRLQKHKYRLLQVASLSVCVRDSCVTASHYFLQNQLNAINQSLNQ